MDREGNDIRPDLGSSSGESADRDRLKQLITRAKAGDNEAVGGVLEAYRNYLRHVARTRMALPLARRLDASDLVQEALLEAHRGIEDLLAGDEQHLRACLRQILCCNIANAIRDHLHTAKRNADLEHPVTQGFDAVSSGTSPSMQVHRYDLANRFLEILEAMPADEATTIRLRYFAGASVNEIAETIGRSRGAAASLLKRALAHIRSELQQEGTAWM